MFNKELAPHWKLVSPELIPQPLEEQLSSCEVLVGDGRELEEIIFSRCFFLRFSVVYFTFVGNSEGSVFGFVKITLQLVVPTKRTKVVYSVLTPHSTFEVLLRFANSHTNK